MANTGVLTKKHNIELANLFYSSVLSDNSSYYVFAGKHIPWDDENNPPTTNDSIFSSQLSVYSDILFGKQVGDNNIRLLIPRNTWVTNTVYTDYSPDTANLYSSNFYVINSSNNVYKVLDNNNDAYSIVEPTVVTTDIFRTSDGYTWKYMYGVSSTDMSNFSCANFIPVVPNTSVQSAAISGSIDVIRVTNVGTGWATYNTGSLQAVINAAAVTISSNSSSNDNFYTNSSIYLKSGLGAGQIKKIRSYNGSTKITQLYEPLDFYVNLTLANAAGLFTTGSIVTQDTSFLVVTSKSGYFQPGDVLEQYVSNTYTATGTVVIAGDGDFKIVPITTQKFLSNYPASVPARGSTLKTGTVDANTTSNTVTGSATDFVAEYSVGDYIRIGGSNTYPFYRITSITNTTSLSISGPAANAVVANVHYKVNSGLTVSSVTNVSANGTVVFSDLDTVKLTISDFTGTFRLGELITQSNSSTNGIISFVNTSTLVVTNIVGPGFQASNSVIDFRISGLSSATTANVTIVTATPTVTLQSAYRDFVVGANVTSSLSGTALLAGITTIPNEQTEYVISPTVNITGDGTNAAAYSVVNTSLGTIESIVVFDPGVGYVHPDANYNTTTATLEANSLYGANAVLYPVISPVGGHGYEPATELGASYAGVTVEFGNTINETYALPAPTTFRRVGLIKNPKWNDVTLTLSDYDRVKIDVDGVATGTASQGEVVYQPTTNAAGIVVFANLTFIELQSVKGTFANSGNVYAFYSATEANVEVVTTSVFSVSTNTQTVTQETTGATGTLVFANSSAVELTNVLGNFTTGYKVYDASTNSYATVSAVKIHDNSKATTFSKFNNTMRLTLSSNTRPYTNNEVIEFKTPILNTTFAQGLVLSANSELDLAISSPTTSFNQYETVTQGAANAVVLFSNATHIKLTQIQGTFSNTANVVGVTSTAQANVTAVYPVLVLSDIEGIVAVSNSNYVYGTTSGANGFCAIANTITYPELVRDTGSALYIENISPVTKSIASKETVKLVIKF